MKIITISREFGSGGRELGKRLADALGFDYYDREIIAAIAQARGLDENYVEHALESHDWQHIPLTFHHSFTSVSLMQTIHTDLLREQRRVLDGIAGAGRDCVIVGRNADILLRDQKPLTIFICADMDSKVRRCMERAPDNEHLSRRQIQQNIRRIDKGRAQSREMISDSKWGLGSSYHITINTSGWSIKELTPVVADFARRWFEQTQ